jgi:hypothetical protein
MSMPSSRLEVATTARQPAGLERLFDVLALLAGDAAVVRPGDDRGRPGGGPGLRHDLGGQLALLLDGLDLRLLGGDLVEPGAEPLRAAPRVGEDDRGTMPGDEVVHPFLDGGPDRRLPGALLGAVVVGLVQPRHVRNGHLHRDLDGLGRARLHDGHRRGAAEEARGLLDRAHRRRQPDPLGGLLQQGVEAFEGQGEVGAALGGARPRAPRRRSPSRRRAATRAPRR